MFSNKVNIQEIINNNDQYDFKCNAVMIKPLLEIYKKGTNQLILTQDMSTVITNGTLNQAYSEAFFKDLEEQLKQSFIKVVTNNGKTKE